MKVSMSNFFQYTKYLALPLVLLMPAVAQDQGISRAQADEILNELRQIRQLLEKQGRYADLFEMQAASYR